MRRVSLSYPVIVVLVSRCSKRFAVDLKISVLPQGLDSLTRFACPECGSTNPRLRDLNPLSAVLLVLVGMPFPLGMHVIDCPDCKHSFFPRWKRKKPVRT